MMRIPVLSYLDMEDEPKNWRGKFIPLRVTFTSTVMDLFSDGEVLKHALATHIANVLAERLVEMNIAKVETSRDFSHAGVRITATIYVAEVEDGALRFIDDKFKRGG